MAILDQLLQQSVIVSLAVLGALITVLGTIVEGRSSTGKPQPQVGPTPGERATGRVDRSLDTDAQTKPPATRGRIIIRAGYLIAGISVILFIIAGFRSAYT